VRLGAAEGREAVLSQLPLQPPDVPMTQGQVVQEVDRVIAMEWIDRGNLARVFRRVDRRRRDERVDVAREVASPTVFPRRGHLDLLDQLSMRTDYD
jgi:hypothetical protein